MASTFASSRVREVEHRSASACKCETSSIAVRDDGWSVSPPNNEGGSGDHCDADGHPLVECRILADGTSIRVAPMERASGGWSNNHFHEHLRLPESSPAGKGVTVLLEAMGRECVAVALSPHRSYELGKTYVVHLGANGNLQTVLRRHVNFQECVDVAVPSRVCAEDAWVPYWIVLQAGTLSAGVGRVPGRNCVGTLDDSMYDMLRSGVDAVKYVGIGNSALQRNARDLRVRNVVVTSIPTHFGLEGIPINKLEKFVNILEMGYGKHGNQTAGGGFTPTDADLLADYKRERAKARARAEKFGIEYKEPPPDAFLKWSEARRLRANPERGFVTGIDTFSAEEKAKAEARKERFRREERKRKGLLEEEDAGFMDERDTRSQGGEREEDIEEDDGADDVAEWEKTKRDPLPVEQAWENWKLVERFRVDPPAGLLTASGGNAAGTSEVVLSSSFSNDIWHGDVGVKTDTEGDDAMDGETETKEFVPKKVAIVPTKIHVFSIDWAPFKQIRTDDLLSYFRDYGPSYVEWLGELSCNVLFEDRHSAMRAFRALSRELPSPPPEGAGKRDRESNRIEKEDDEDIVTSDAMEEAKNAADDNDDRDGAEKNSVDDNDDGEKSSGEVAAKRADDMNDASKQQAEGETPLPDYGGVGWRFCKWTVRKVSNDRHGRRGTRARMLMRLATTADVLEDRPTEWPQPPPGFTTKRVLMPWDDFSRRRRHGRGNRKDAKRRRRGGGGWHGDGSHDDDECRAGGEYDRGGEHPGLSKGLRSGRSGGKGFSVEELQAERNAKNA